MQKEAGPLTNRHFLLTGHPLLGENPGGSPGWTEDHNQWDRSLLQWNQVPATVSSLQTQPPVNNGIRPLIQCTLSHPLLAWGIPGGPRDPTAICQEHPGAMNIDAPPPELGITGTHCLRGEVGQP